MEGTVKEKIRKITPGDVQQFRNVCVFPLFSHLKPPVEHLVLKEAIEKGCITIAEVSEGGHVPELKVTNSAGMPVLILDGEELFGAKQNRVLNTTVLLRKKSVTVIPVSCTEQGRWSYHSKTFTESGIMMSPNIRRVKNRSVQASLRSYNEFRSDQGAVWDGISEQASFASVNSPTHAMRDTHDEIKEDIRDYAGHFPCLEYQQGILVAIGGKIVGLDMVSCESAYAQLHDKLMKSYVMDAILKGNGKEISTDRADAVQFIDAVSECEESRYKSVGHGWDVRFEGKNVFGSALQYRGGVVHCAFFTSRENTKTRDDGRMYGYERRAAFRNRRRGNKSFE